jgi:putative FmdB family regulatory protein
MRYEYECPACGNIIEIERKITDTESIYDCPTPKCDSTLNRKYSAPAIEFRGKGWYSTDK